MANKILRLVYLIIHWSIFVVLIGFVLLRKSNIFINMVLLMYGIEIFFKIRKYMFLRRKYLRLLKEYKDMFKEFKKIHAERYSLYLSGDIEKIEEYTKVIDYSATELLECGMDLLKFSKSNEKEKQEINIIIKQIKLLIENICPTV